MQRIAELADLVTRIVTLDQAGPGASELADFEVAVPLVDLAHPEIHELAADLDAPMDLCRDPGAEPAAIAG